MRPGQVRPLPQAGLAVGHMFCHRVPRRRRRHVFRMADVPFDHTNYSTIGLSEIWLSVERLTNCLVCVISSDSRRS
jgi:hypothetical protein